MVTRELAADGGRATEFFFHITANPSSELTLHVAGRTLAAPEEPLDTHLHAALNELYAPPNAESLGALATFFLDAEDMYFRHLPADECGTISLEPLVGDRPGPPVYLRDRLQTEQRAGQTEDRQGRRIGQDTGKEE